MGLETNVYIDGFNLYYGCVKGTSYRWLNLSKLCTMLLPRHHVKKIKYFTSLIRPQPNDPQQLQRQLTYIRALKTIPNLSVYYGQFRTHIVKRPLAHPTGSNTNMVEVLDTKEKGSDVNLATHLLADGFNKEYQIAVIVSNDSDLVEPIKFVTNQLHLPIGILHPHKQFIRELSKLAEFYRPIREKAIKASLFPPTLTDANGTITKPPSW